MHDLNHDGHLYDNRAQFLERVAKINEYGRKFGARGFRAGVLYRNQDWFDRFEFDYENRSLTLRTSTRNAADAAR